MDREKICKAALACQQLFDSCVSSVPCGYHDASMRSAQGDFNLWCAAIRATSVGKPSLDYRLRDHPDVREIVCNWLASLKASLEKYASGPDDIDDEDPAEDETAPPDSPLRTVSPASWDSISDRWSDSDSFAHKEAPVGADYFATECISYIRTALDRLAWLSLSIRKAGSRYRFERADKAINASAFSEFRAHLTQIILREFPDPDAAPLTTVQLVERVSDDGRLTAVQNQLIQANILRKNRIEYAIRKRREKSHTIQDARPCADSRGDNDFSVIRSSSIAESTISSLSRPPQTPAMDSNTRPKVAPAAPTATRSTAPTATGIESRFVNPMLSGRAPSAASKVTRVSAAQAYPRCPKASAGSQLECPYCLDVLPSSYSKSEQAWKAHVSQDILPYTCFIEGCSTPEEMYLTSETLIAHLVEEHSSLRWICDFCALNDEISGQPGVRREFHGAEEWEQHITEAHEDRIQTLQEPQLAELAEMNKRPMFGPLQCPLCDFAMPNMSSRVDDHILNHLHEFSLRALPETSQSGDADGSIASSITVVLSHVADIKPAASGSEFSLVLPFQKISNTYDELMHILPSSIEPSLRNFLDWFKEGGWTPTEASQEFWATHFGKLHHLIRTYDEGMYGANTDITPAVLKDTISQTLKDLLAWQLERNPNWVSSPNSNQSQPAWRINVPPSNVYFVTRDEVLNEFIGNFLDDLEAKLFLARPRLQFLTPGDALPSGDDIPIEDGHSGLRSRRQSSRVNVQPRFILTGGQGAGKTAIAVELAHRIAGEHSSCSVFWVDATSAISIQESYQKIWKSVGEPQGPLCDFTRALIYHLNWGIRGPWLMVLDGIHTHTLQQMVFKDWIPSGLNGTLLLTTRDASALSILGSAQSVQMPPLPPLPPSPPSQPGMLPGSLWTKIAGARTSTEYPYKVEFWPEGSLDEITGTDITTELYEYSANRAVNAVDNGLVHFILKHATKLFTACYISQIRRLSLRQTMEFFRIHSFNDNSLPFRQEDISQYADRLPWDTTHMLSFLQSQWKFIAQRFSMDRPLVPVPLPTSTILPFVQVSPLGQGNFGTIYKVMVHPSHLDRDDPTHQTHCQVAIKEVILRGGNYEDSQFGQDTLSEREKRAHLYLLSLKDKDPECVKHIVNVKAIFDQGWKRYYMFPWADGGHLWNLWERRRVIQPQGEGRFVADIVAQILGLAEALVVLHQGNWRHGDLKPENILIFKRQNQPDIWKISDFGLAKFHLDSTQRRGPTSTRHGTTSYEPPEFLRDHQPISRLHDIWSMGCTILQLITWILYDLQGIIELTERTQNRYQGQSTFWSQRSILGVWSRQVVHEEVKSHMKQILKDATGSQAIKDLLAVVKDKLLVIQLPSDIEKEWRPGYRANAETLHGELVKISKRGESDPRYWFAGGTLSRKPANAKSSATASRY